MQKYVLVSFLKPIDNGAEFMVGHWPLHTTLVANFALDLSGSQLPNKLTTLFAQHQPLQTIATEDDYFGPERQVHVTRLMRTPELASLHNQTVALIRNCHGVFDEPHYLEDGYKPHVTVQADGRVHAGDPVRISTITLVDMFPDGDIAKRRVMQAFRLGASEV